MNQGLGFNQQADCQMIRNRHVLDKLPWLGKHVMEHWRPNKAGILKKINEFIAYNDIVNQGKNDILTVYFYGGTQTLAASWYLGLISSTGYTGLAATDVMTSHAGWTEFTNYSETNRVAWGPAAPASQSVTSTAPAQFDITASGTVKGIFVVTDNTKGGTAGKLWSTALYSADVPVNSGDQLKSNYTLSC